MAENYASFKTFQDIVTKHHIYLDKNIQRGFEWKPSDDLRTTTHEFEDMELKSGILRDRGTMYLVKNPDETFIINGEKTCSKSDIDSGNRLFQLVLKAIAAKRVADELLSCQGNIAKEDTEKLSKLNVFAINQIFSGLKNGNFVPVPSDQEIYNLILNGDKIDGKLYSKNKVYQCYLINLEFLKKLVKKDIDKFVDYVNFICNDICFIVAEYEHCDEQAQRRKYEEINADSVPQSKVHRAVSNIRDVAAMCSLDTLFKFDNDYENFREELSKNGFKKDAIETAVEVYIASSVLSCFGTTKKNETNLIDIVKKQIKYDSNAVEGSDEDKRNAKVKEFIENMFNNGKTFIKLKTNKLKWNITKTVSMNKSIKFDIALFSHVASVSSIRLYYLAVLFKLFEYYIITDDGDITGYKDEKNPNNQYADMFICELARFYMLDKMGCSYDCRSKLHQFIKDGGSLNTSESYKTLFKTNKEWHDSVLFKNNTLLSLKQVPRYVALAIIQTQSQHITKEFPNQQDYFIHAKMFFTDNDSYDVDHILTRKYCSDNDIPDLNRDCVGNLRLLEKSANRKENHGENEIRVIDANDVTFYPGVRGNKFTENDIEPNLEYKSNLFKDSVFFEQYKD